MLPLVDDSAQALIARQARELEELRGQVKRLDARQISCECDPLRPDNDRCNGKFFRCEAGIRAMNVRRRKKEQLDADKAARRGSRSRG